MLLNDRGRNIKKKNENVKIGNSVYFYKLRIKFKII